MGEGLIQNPVDKLYQRKKRRFLGFSWDISFSSFESKLRVNIEPKMSLISQIITHFWVTYGRGRGRPTKSLSAPRANHRAHSCTTL
jgi:hypothetical protein